MKIVIDIADWAEEAEGEEDIRTREDIIEALNRGLSTGVVARATIVDRERGVADEDIILSNKALLNLGAQLEVAKVARSATDEVIANSGKIYRTRTLVGRVHNLATNQEGDEESYVPLEDDRAMQRAMDYLLEIIPGHIWSRLKVIHAKGGDVEEATDELKAKINHQVYALKYSKVVT